MVAKILYTYHAEKTFRVLAMIEVKKCPKCGGEMEEGKGLASYMSYVYLMKKSGWRGNKIHTFYCSNCGFIEIYGEIKKKVLNHE